MLGAGGVAVLGPLTALFPALAFGQVADTLTIAFNVALPSWDPTSGPSSVNPTLQALWKSVFDPFIDQNNDASFKPGLLTKWGWIADKTKVEMELRAGALWHDGSPVAAQEIALNLNRAADPKTGNPVGAIIWSSTTNLKVDGNKITGEAKQYVANLFKRMAFLTGYAIPQRRYEKVGAAGFEKQPIGSGPYMETTRRCRQSSACGGRSASTPRSRSTTSPSTSSCA